MAGKNSTKRAGKASDVLDVFAESAIYKLRRDALMIVSNMNRGSQAVSSETLKRQLVLVQGQLCSAACADPKISDDLKDHLFAFHCATITENITDRRGARRRTPRAILGRGGV